MVIEGTVLHAFGTIVVDIPENYQYNPKKLSVAYLPNMEVAEVKKKERKAEAPQPKRKKRSANTTIKKASD